MSRNIFILPNVAPGTRVRFDTASGTDTPADLEDFSGTTIAGAIITADSAGKLANIVYAPGTVLYVKTLDGSGNPTGSPTTLKAAVTEPVLPAGGAAGDVLTKASDTDGDADWETPSGGASAQVFTAKTADYTAANGDAVLVDASGGPVVITLPAPAADASVTVKKTDVSSNTVQVLPHAAETIDGAAANTLTTQYQSRGYASDGTDWWVI